MLLNMAAQVMIGSYLRNIKQQSKLKVNRSNTIPHIYINYDILSYQF